MELPRHPAARQPIHVWVDYTGSFGSNRYPGILVEWRQAQVKAAVRWQGLVAFAESDEHGWRLRTEWVLAENLQPALE